MESTSIFILFKSLESVLGNKDNISLFKEVIGDNVIDLLHNIPSKAITTNYCNKWEELEDQKRVTIKVKVIKHYSNYFNKKLPYRINVTFNNKVIGLVFFSKYTGYLKKIYPVEDNVYITGKIDLYNKKYQITHPDLEKDFRERDSTNSTEAIYKQKKGLKSEQIQVAVKKVLNIIPELKEWNKLLIQNYKDIPTWKEAIKNIHKPSDIKQLNHNSSNIIRLAYDELLANQITLGLIRNSIKRKESNIYLDDNYISLNKLLSNISFKLTTEQLKTIKEILNDLNSSNRMMRLLHGDVGTGKTIVAILTALYIAKSNYQIAIMVPSELLAKQHFFSIKKITKELSIETELLTSNVKDKKLVLDKIKLGTAKIVIGTQALIQKQVVFKCLSYVIIDEQHRFGVEQRLKIREKGKNVDMLLMSATPIPRTMLLATLGDISVSTLRQKPHKNLIRTIIKSEKNIMQVVEYLSELILKGEKVFWVCPMIDEDTTTTKITVESRFKMLKKHFNKIDILHGKLKPEEKDKALNDFKSGITNILVSTVVIEVGIDVPDASVILIDSADAFGLAQIHQLRGRIGRGKKNGTCILVYREPLSEQGHQRLMIMKGSNNGFEIAEKDLLMRGGGELLGTKQYGCESFIFFDPVNHFNLLKLAKDEANQILDDDPKLKKERGKRIIDLLYIFKKNKAIDLISAG